MIDVIQGKASEMFEDRSSEMQLSVIRRLPRHCPIVFWLTFIIALGCFGLAHSSLADTFVFESGETFQGTIVLATRNIVTIKLADGGLHVGKIADIREVRLDTQNGQSIVGRLLSWSSNGVYEIKSDGQVVRIREGHILSGEARRAKTDKTNPSVPADQENGKPASSKKDFLNFLRERKGKELAE